MVADEKPWKKYYNPEVNKRATAKFRKEKMRQIGLSFHLEHDADLLARIDQEPNKAGYIKRLIRDDIKRTGWKPSVQSGDSEAEARKLFGM